MYRLRKCHSSIYVPWEVPVLKKKCAIVFGFLLLCSCLFLQVGCDRMVHGRGRSYTRILSGSNQSSIEK